MLLDLSKPRYDQSTYYGRLCHFSRITNPLNLLASSTTLEQAKKRVEDYKSGFLKVANAADGEKVWQAKYLVDATYHPDTGEKIFLPFRMSAFVPVNLILVAGMLMPNPSMKSVVFWQLLNQSANVAFNYSNANKTTEMNLSETAVAYAAAVTTSVGIALGLNHGVKRLPPSIGPTTSKILSRMIPFTAVVAAGTVNVFLMRMKEIRDGIHVTDEEGTNHGRSKKAGLSAVTQVAVSRCVSSIPVMLFPPFALSLLERTSFLRNRPSLVTPVNFGLIAASLLTALPASVAIFPQRPLVKANSLEPQFHKLKDSKGDPIERLLFNKGL